MIKNKFISEIIISLVFVGLIIALLNPFSIWMPDMMQMLFLVVLVVSFALYVGFVWRENPADERETVHMIMAGRLAFLGGMLVLVIGIVWQSFQHNLDWWLPITLAVMVLMKIVSLIYYRHTH